MTTVFVHALTGRSGKWSEMAEKSRAHRVASGFGALRSVEPSDDGRGPFASLFAEPDVSIARFVAAIQSDVMAIRGLANVPKVVPSVVSAVFAGWAAIKSDVVDYLPRPLASHPQPRDAMGEIPPVIYPDSPVSVGSLLAGESASGHAPTRLFPAKVSSERVVVQEFADASGSEHVVHLDSGGRAPVRTRYRTSPGLQSRFPAPKAKIP